MIAIYRRDLPKCHVNPKSRKWLLEAYPSLDRGTAWNRTLYDMNVHSWDAPYSTGICLSLSLFISEVLSEQDIEIFGLYDRGQFNHSIIKYQDKFYDAFHPQGVDKIDSFMYADICDLAPIGGGQIRAFFDRGPVTYLRENLYAKVVK